MKLSLIPRPFWNLPSLIDDEDFWTSGLSSTSGVSISEDEKNVYVATSLPGLDQDDIDVTFSKGVVRIIGEKKEKEEDKKRKFYRRSETSFSYQIAVPGEIDYQKEPDAVYKNGVLTLTFVKSPSAQPKKISVKSAK